MKRHIPLLGLAILVLAATSAGALHTLEPYGPGASYLEIQVRRGAQGADPDSLRTWDAFFRPGWGISPSLSAYLELGASSSDAYEGGLEFVTMGLLRNVFDRSLNADLFAEIRAEGEGLRRGVRTVGCEFESNAAGWGAWFRSRWSWRGDGADPTGQVVVGRSRVLSEGMWLRMGPAVHLLFEITHESLHGFRTLDNGSRDATWTLGYNRVLTEKVSFTFDARRYEMVTGEKVWDYSTALIIQF